MTHHARPLGVPNDHCGRLSRRSLLVALAASAWVTADRIGSAQTGSSRRSFYVSPSGNDMNAGTLESPFATIGGAFRHVSNLGAGDEIVVLPGLYEEAVVVSAGGNASGNLTLVSKVRHAAKIRSPSDSYSAIAIQRSYVSIDGFDVQSGGSGHGIEATFLDGDSRSNGPHHITISNNVCHDSPGSGISVSYGDFYRIENNVCFRNCATNEYQGSGISVYEARAVEGVEDTRIVVSSNTCFGNLAIALPGGVAHSDGNGIIIDDLRNTQKPSSAGAYRFRTLVENNVCYFNGGKGIHVFFSDNVIVRNNTCCYNNHDPKNPASWRGELSNVNSGNTLWVNNIGVADPSTNAWNAAILDASAGGQPNDDVVWVRNLTFNGTVGIMSATQSPENPTLTSRAPYGNFLGVDPLFVKGDAGEVMPDFRLLPRSPARDAGTAEWGVGITDRLEEPRIFGSRPDIGAFEYNEG